MDILNNAIAGTLESSDAQVQVFPQSGKLSIYVESSVMNQYGRQIKKTAEETLAKLKVKEGKVVIIDKGALECTLKSRIECAVFRSCGQSESNIPWEVL